MLNSKTIPCYSDSDYCVLPRARKLRGAKLIA